MITEGTTVNKRIAVYIAAAVAVSTAGVIHLMLGPNFFTFNPGQALLFTVGGLIQIFWIMPMVKRWGRVWYVIGILGNLALFLIWLVTRLPENPISGRGFPMINPMQIIEEAAQLTYIGLASAILLFEHRKISLVTRDSLAQEKQAEKTSRNGLMILAGVIVGLIVTSLVLLPALMARPTGQRGSSLGPGAPTFQSSPQSPSVQAPAQAKEAPSH